MKEEDKKFYQGVFLAAAVFLIIGLWWASSHYETKIIKNGHAKYNETTGEFMWSKCK